MPLPAFLMFDDFVANPHELRRQALGLGYTPAAKAGNYPGITSDRPLIIPGLDDFVSRAIGVPVRADPGTLHGHCRLTLKRDRGASGVHIDPAFYSGILYLSLPEDEAGGTDFYRHKRTGLERVPTSAQSRPAAWERAFTAPMRFNRLILFSPWMFHNSAAGFGDGPENGRLAYLMFFARAALFLSPPPQTGAAAAQRSG